MPYKDPEDKKTHSRAYHAANREKIIAYQRAYRAVNRDVVHAKDRARSAANREQRNAQGRVYHAANREQRNAKKRAHHAANREQRNAQNRASYAANREQRLAQKLTYSEKNRDRISAYQRAYHVANRDKRAANSAQRRARKNHAPLNDFTLQQWQEIKEHYDHRCVYCGRKMQRLTMDHLLPIAKGGSHTASNIVPSCASCNSKKGTGKPLRPVQPLLLTLAASRPGKKRSS